MLRGAWVPLVLAWFAVSGCNAITTAPGSPAPVNACGGNSGLTCDAFHSDAGVLCLPTDDAGLCMPGTGAACVCQVSKEVNPVDPSLVLVVGVPPLAPSAGGTTYAVSIQDLFDQTTPNMCHDYQAPAPDVCFQLAAAQAASGGYLISSEQAVEANRYVGAAASVTLPVTVTFWPMWTPPSGVATDARLLNLPLPPVFASVGCNVASSDLLLEASLETCPGGDGTFLPFEWLAQLAPSRYSPGYASVVEVVAPFNDAFPDLSYPVTIVAGNEPDSTGDLAELGLLPPPSGSPAPIKLWQGAPLIVKRADGEPFTGGWTAYLRDRTTHQAITSRAAVAGTSTSAALNYISTQPPVLGSYEVIVEPPPGVPGVPTLVDPLSLDTGVEIYPALPPIVHVSGDVVSPYGGGASATLLFFASALADTATCALGVEPLVGSLQYEALVETDDLLAAPGVLGHFSVDLPQGLYSVVIDPTAGSFYAKTVQSFTSVAVTPPVCSGGSPTLDGVTLTAGLPVTVTGRFVTADGRSLAGASVDFTPAAALAPTLSPAAPPLAASLPCPPDGCSEIWPRPFTTTTETDGTFRIDVDKGEYDMTARPADGTGWPWFVTPDLVVTARPADGGLSDAASTAVAPLGQTLQPSVIPAPFFLSVSLLAPDQSPVAGAEVEAYAASSSARGVAYVLIGQALTDANGHFSMMLTTAFPSN